MVCLLAASANFGAPTGSTVRGKVKFVVEEQFFTVLA
jgi:hypothetical protein